MVKTTGKEYFYMVSGLMAPKYMVDERLAENIEFFIDWVSKNAAHLERLLKSDSLALFTNRMEELYVLLCSISAHWLEMEAARILRMVEINESELVQRLTEPFIANLRTLAIDVQLAQNKEFEMSYRQRDDIEHLRGEISNLKIIFTLIKNHEYDKAFDLTVGMHELQESEHAAELMDLIVSKKSCASEQLLESLTNFYLERIEDVVEATTKSIVQKKILLVDDMPEDLAALSYMLKGRYQVFAFTETKEALHFIENKQPPDAFILDIEMPEMDGFDLAKKIRENMLHAHTPIIFLTGNSSREMIVKSTLYRPKAFIVKPSNKATILSKLSSCLK